MRTASRITALVALSAALAVLLAAAAAHAEEAHFKVIIVKATNDGDSMDASLKRYAHLLKNRGYTNFTKVGTVPFSLEKKAKKTFRIAGRLTAEIEYTSEVNDRIAFKCRVLNGKKEQLNIGYSIPRGHKTMVVVRGKTCYMLIIEVS
jgi:hypothetical protein